MKHFQLFDGTTLTGAEVDSAQFFIEPWNNHDLRINYTPIDTSVGVELNVKMYESFNDINTVRDSSTWFKIGEWRDPNADGGKVFIQTILRLRADQAAERLTVRQFPLGARKIKVSIEEIGSPSSFGTADLSLSSYIA